MEATVKKYNDGILQFNELCRVYNVPKPTFRQNLEGLYTHQKN